MVSTHICVTRVHPEKETGRRSTYTYDCRMSTQKKSRPKNIVQKPHLYLKLGFTQTMRNYGGAPVKQIEGLPYTST